MKERREAEELSAKVWAAKLRAQNSRLG